MLREETGLAVRSFASINTALQSDDPLVIIADTRSLSGDDALASLRARFTAPVILLSHRPSLSAAVKAMRAGASDFFPIPASAAALGARVRSLLQHSRPNGRTLARAGTAGESDLMIVPFWEQERDIIESALSLCNGNISRAAAALQISPSTIYRKKLFWDSRLAE